MAEPSADTTTSTAKTPEADKGSLKIALEMTAEQYAASRLKLTGGHYRRALMGGA